MLTRAVLVCVAVILPTVCSFVVQKLDDDVADQYFAHPLGKWPHLSPRIVGGEEVIPHSYPFQAVLVIIVSSSLYICGGSLISNQWVLTAAHCLTLNPDYILVGLGIHDLTEFSSANVQNTTKYFPHEGYDSVTFQNDLGLIRLPQNVTFTEHIQPVSIVNVTDQYAGDNATLIGWGQTETEYISYVLLAVNTTILSNDDCANTNLSYKEVIKPTHICTSGVGSVGACRGDSGGPLLVDGIQVGVVAFGTADCQLGLPSVFTRLTEYRDWILENTKDDGQSQDN